MLNIFFFNFGRNLYSNFGSHFKILPLAYLLVKTEFPIHFIQGRERIPRVTSYEKPRKKFCPLPGISRCFLPIVNKTKLLFGAFINGSLIMSGGRVGYMGCILRALCKMNQRILLIHNWHEEDGDDDEADDNIHPGAVCSSSVVRGSRLWPVALSDNIIVHSEGLKIRKTIIV